VCRFIAIQQGCVSLAALHNRWPFHRVAASTLDASDESVHLLLPVLRQLKPELSSVGYSPVILNQSIRHSTHTQQWQNSHAEWRALWRKVQAMCSSGPRASTSAEVDSTSASCPCIAEWRVVSE
jgi:hypothetical protein